MTARIQNGAATTYTINGRNQATAISGLGSAILDINGNLTNRVYDGRRVIEERASSNETTTRGSGAFQVQGFWNVTLAFLLV